MVNRKFLVPLLLLILPNCTGTALGLFDVSTENGGDARRTSGDSLTTEVYAEKDLANADSGPVAEDLYFDSGSEMPFVECEPGTGCFLDECDQNGECRSGYCVEHMGEAVCTRTCSEECPPGWSCRLIMESKPDVVYICVSDYANLCKPCAANSGCIGSGGAADVCVDYAEEGNFCGGPCDLDADCPWGFACKEVNSVEGVPVTQCFAEAGVCPCTATSVEKGLATPCATENEWGVCYGKRVCTIEGLTECDAGLPSKEACNGEDDNCDGDVDEAIFVEGKYVDLCDDNNPCTDDACLGLDGCGHTVLSQGECVDGDACTVGDHCEEGECVGLPIICDDDNPCTDDLCDGQGGCKTQFNLLDCDDGDPCTVADSCEEGVCSGFAVQCDCLENADCAGLEDGNLCNGSLACDMDSLPYKCAVAPATVVSCPLPQDGASICVAVACEPATGECLENPAFEGFACDDGDPCTVGEACALGLCVGDVTVNCDDGNVCTNDSCLPGEGCQHQDNLSVCDDNDVCTTNDVCNAGLCGGGPVLACDDGNVCTLDSCDGKAGCQHAPLDAQCDDGNECTSGDHCDNGQCVFTQGVDCDDDNPCTKDSCTPSGGCTYQIIAAACNDGNPCTINDHCINGACVAGATVDCDDHDPCTDDSCGDSGLCLHEANSAQCDDDNACTLGDKCEDGICAASQLLYCNDNDVCTTDICDPDSGCLFNLNESPCDDNDVCTIGDHCHLGGCISSSTMTCDDSNSCTDDACDAATGCEFVPNTNACDDGNACTENDACQGGTCAPGKTLDCDDGNVCTNDLCYFAVGCQHFDNSLPCNDFDACTANEFCNSGACGGGVAIVCDDQNPCTDDSCAADTGCVFDHNTVACTDNDACTDGDLCSDGACAPGPALDCEDNNVCTTDSCDAADGCHNDPVQNETPCGEELHCIAGACVDVCNHQPGSQTLGQNNTIQTFTVPECVESITIEAWGGQGGRNQHCAQTGGLGARMKGTFDVTPGEVLKIVVGQRGKDWGYNHANEAGTGAGGSFVWRNNGTELLLVAGGGGGGAICAGGGNPTDAPGIGGTTGTSGTASKKGNHQGGSNGADGQHSSCGGRGWNTVQSNPAGMSGGPGGGYGGGGCPGDTHSGGGGGGYSGGGCTPYSPASGGGGGGSYNSGSNQDSASAVKTGDGQVTLTW